MSNSLQEEILKLKEEKNAIILAHNYQPKEVQEIADFLGDSLELCIKASEIDDKDLVIFCGVSFQHLRRNVLWRICFLKRNC